MKRILFLVIVLLIFSSCTYVLSETVKTIDKVERAKRPLPSLNKNNPYSNSRVGKLVNIDANYRIKLPFDMIKNTDYEIENKISYSNPDESLSVLIYKESLEDYKDYKSTKTYLIDSIPLMESFKNGVKNNIYNIYQNAKIEDYGLLEINEFKARQLKILTEDEQQKPVMSILSLLKVEDSVYHILSWTSKDNFGYKMSSMEQIPFTFEKKPVYK